MGDLNSFINFSESMDFRTTERVACPYLSDRFSRNLFSRLPFEGDISRRDSLRGSLLASGFRRFQDIYYCPVCESCNCCVSVRVLVSGFNFSRKSFRRLLNCNRDLSFTSSSVSVDSEVYDLFCSYMSSRHGGCDILSYSDFCDLVEVGSEHSIFYRAYDGGGRLLGLLFADRGVDNFSAVHSFFAPDLVRRGLGNWLILRLLQEAIDLSMDYVYLGYWVEGSASMSYKSRFQPLEYYAGGIWREWRT